MKKNGGLQWGKPWIALLLWIAILGAEVHAQQPPTVQRPGGFGRGDRTFSNPFADAMPGPGDEEDEEDEDAAPSTSPPPRISIGKGGMNRADDVPDPKRVSGGFAVGGEPPSGVLSEKEFNPLKIDSETGQGTNAVITDFNFPDADVIDIAKTLGKLTGKSFVYDKTIKGRVTLVANSPITVGDAWKAFLTALDINGFAIVPSGKFLRITRQRDARDKQLNTYTDERSPDTDALITRVFPLKYIGAEEVARTFRSFMPANSRIIPHEQTNTVIVTDTGSNISKLSKMLEFLDVEGFDAGIEVVPVKFASAVELAKLIDQLLPGTSAGGAPGVRTRVTTPGRAGFSARKTKEGGLINNIIADERTNALIVHANNRGVDQVRQLVAKLDAKVPAAIGGGKIHVIYLQFADAKKVAETLNQLSSQAGQRPASRLGGATTGVNPANDGLFEGSIKVSADESTNSIVVTANPSDFVTIQRVIAKLDIARDQVYVETVIMEMSLENNFQFSTNVALPNKGIASAPRGGDLVDFLTSPLAQQGMVLGFKSNDTTSFTVGGQTLAIPNVTALIKAIQTHAQGNVLATPQILTLDNTEAEFESAERIPILTTTSNQGVVNQNITKENVGLKIKIKPMINKAAEFVKLEIATTLEDISNREPPGNVKDLAFATITRTAKTTVVVGNADTVVLGGLIRDKADVVESKIPILGDIPLLGWLFKSRRSSSSKTNLLIFMTPHIIKQYEKVRALLDKKLQQRDKFLEEYGGGEDPYREQRDEIIKGLPDIKTLGDNQSLYKSVDEDDGIESSPEVPSATVDEGVR